MNDLKTKKIALSINDLEMIIDSLNESYHFYRKHNLHELCPELKDLALYLTNEKIKEQ